MLKLILKLLHSIIMIMMSIAVICMTTSLGWTILAFVLILFFIISSGIQIISYRKGKL